MNYIEIKTLKDFDRFLLAHSDGDAIAVVRSGQFVARGRTHMEAWGDALVEAWGDALVVARGNARVEACENAHVEARGNAHVVAWGDARVEAWGDALVVARGDAHVEAREDAHVVAWENAHVEAREDVHVVAWGDALVEAWGSARVEALEDVHVVAWESANVVARGSVHVEAWGDVYVEASQSVAIHQHSSQAVVHGGRVIHVRPLATPAEWVAYYGVKVVDGVALLYKGVRDDYRSERGTLYLPGTLPEAPDWDGGEVECGGGLHFSPHPSMVYEFDGAATRFVACPVALEDMRVPRGGDSYPTKIKARRVCGPIAEVDRYGRLVKTPVTSVAP